jgi:hypothetical protein
MAQRRPQREPGNRLLIKRALPRSWLIKAGRNCTHAFRAKTALAVRTRASKNSSSGRDSRGSHSTALRHLFDI